MALISPGIPEYEYLKDAPPTIVGDLGVTGLVGYIRIYKNGSLIPVTSSGITEIGNTGSYAWSTSNLPVLGGPREQFFYIFTAGSYSDDGQFILKVPGELQVMPSVNSGSEFLKTIL